MGRFVKDDVVLVPFPYSGEESFKGRPAIVLATLAYNKGTDYLLCLVTTQTPDDARLIPLGTADMESGKLTQGCFIRPGYLCTTGEAQIIRRLGHMKPEKRERVTQALIGILSA